MKVVSFLCIVFCSFGVNLANFPVGELHMQTREGGTARGIESLINIQGLESLGGRLLLTARHCVEDSKMTCFVYDSKEYEVDKVFWHSYPSRNKGDLCTNAGDISVLVLKKNVCFDGEIPFYLGVPAPKGSLVTVKLPESSDVCAEIGCVDIGIYQLEIQSNKKALTSGDSGAPMYVEKNNDTYVVGAYTASNSDGEAHKYLGSFPVTWEKWAYRDSDGDTQQGNLQELLRKID